MDNSTENADTLYEVEDGIATITLNRPDQMNTLGGSMMELVSDYMNEAERDNEFFNKNSNTISLIFRKK